MLVSEVNDQGFQTLLITFHPSHISHPQRGQPSVNRAGTVLNSAESYFDLGLLVSNGDQEWNQTLHVFLIFFS